MAKLQTPETKDFKFTLGAIDDAAGTFTGYASVWDVEDSYHDVVQKGAFKKTLKDKKQFPLLWSHSIVEPIGVVTGVEDDHGLAVEGTINLDVQRGREVRSLMKQGAINGLSIGYQTKKDEIDSENGTRKLKEISLWEISPVVFPALDATEITAVKAVVTTTTDTDEHTTYSVTVTDGDDTAHAGEPDASTPPAKAGDTPEQRLHVVDMLRLKT